MSGFDTIAAISTPLGEGGIGIVRVSGPDAYALANAIFVPSKKKDEKYPEARQLYHGYIKARDGVVLDEVLTSFMPAPFTYTREDIVEINCHSGVFTLRAILRYLLDSGARLAEPGEFTRRAFINGRIDLSQAEAVLNMIRARSEVAVKNAARTLQGDLGNKINRIRDKIIELRAPIEASIDYPEEYDDGEKGFKSLRMEVETLKREIENLIKGIETSRAFQEGITVAIIGRPNVGKSSLLNALLRQQKAIVHEAPGTTRDLLEGYMTIGGYPVKLVDTAGIQETEDPVEIQGIKRAQAAAGMAKMLITVFDGSRQLTVEDEQIAALNSSEQGLVVVINKSDLPQVISGDRIEMLFAGKEVVYTSAAQEKGISLLEEAVTQELDEIFDLTDESSEIVSLRHETILKDVKDHFECVLSSIGDQPMELISYDLDTAWNRLGEITGDTVSEKLLDKIFSEFCLGK